MSIDSTAKGEAMNSRFHWMLPKGGEVAMGSARAAARYRIESTGKSSAVRRPNVDSSAEYLM